jgi:hypothetical protein
MSTNPAINQQPISPENQALYESAYNTLNEMRGKVFFGKLASMGIQPANQEEANMLWQFGMSVLNESPMGSEGYASIKQASVETFGKFAAIPSAGSFSNEALSYAEEIVKIPAFREAVSTLVALDSV